jgi:hypothetical protein
MHLFVFREDKRLHPITDVVKNKIIHVVEQRHLSKFYEIRTSLDFYYMPKALESMERRKSVS